MIDEGLRNKVYEDSLGLKTVGVGHLIKDTDPEEIKNLEIGDKISTDQIYQLLLGDLSSAIQDAIVIFYDKWEGMPSIAQEAFVNMLFNLGRRRFMSFKNMINAAYEQDWEKVSEEMLDSRWATQVGSRARRLSSKIKSLA